MFQNLSQLADLMKNVGKIRETVEKTDEALGQLRVEASSGGGVVSATANGRFEILAIRIDPKLLADGDAELLEDLVMSAVNQALAKAREAAAQSIQSLTGGLPIPGISGLFGGPGVAGSGP
jgi:DNA-binding YbaB/EbfC family protein